MTIRHDWQYDEVAQLFQQPFNDLLLQAQLTHRQYFAANTMQLSTLLSIKTGGCPENCAYCPQSAHYAVGKHSTKLMALAEVVAAARQAQANGATRFCMGAAWRQPRERDFAQVLQMVTAVKALGLETCVTLGMLTKDQVERLAAAGLDYYNHNLDTSAEFYEQIISTRRYEERLATLALIDASTINICCGGIVGMGEGETDRINFLLQLANMSTHPPSVPINALIKVASTPLENVADLDPIEFVQMIAVTRIVLPQSRIRLSAGRKNFSPELHALCFFAGANSIFIGDKLLVTKQPNTREDLNLLQQLGIKPLTINDQENTDATA